MEYHAIIEKAEDWWIGWLVDLPGVNAQERTRDELLESLELSARDMLDLTGTPDPDVQILVLRDAESATHGCSNQESNLGASGIE